MKKEYVKNINYNMTAEIYDALESIMREHDIATMTGAINYCVTNHKPLVEALRKEESDTLKLHRAKIAMEAQITKFAQFQEYVRKNTKDA